MKESEGERNEWIIKGRKEEKRNKWIKNDIIAARKELKKRKKKRGNTKERSDEERMK